MLKRLLQGGGIGLLAAAGAVGLWRAGALDGVEHVTWGWRVRTFAPRAAPDPRIKVILVDQASLDWGKTQNGWAWPWPRTVYTAILDFCKRGGARAVAFDVLFTEPSAYEASDDQALGEAIRRGAPFVGAMFLSEKAGTATQWPAFLDSMGFSVDGLEAWRSRRQAGSIEPSHLTLPIPEVATNAALLANVSDRPDADGVFRRAALFQVFDRRLAPSLGLGAYLAAERAAGRAPVLRLSPGWLEAGDRRAPLDAEGRAILQFRGTNGTHETYSAAAVIQSELRLQAGEKPTVDPAVFKEAVVLFGFSAPGLLDVRPTPLSRVYPGTELHATVLDNLLNSGFIRPMPGAVAAAVAILLAVVSGGATACSRKARHSLLALGILLAAPIVMAFAAYRQGWWWPLTVMEAAVGLALVGGLVLNYATEGRQKAFLKRAFKHYLGAEVIEQIIADPGRLKLGGEKRELTIFFSDIEKFSSFSERLDPATLTLLLNDYLSDMTDIILEEGGYLDKYIGDAIVAFWNAPASQPDHAARAARAVVRCQRRLAERREHYQRTAGVLLKARIGLHTGEVTVGNMGSRDRFNYTILGDAANLASRLEGANKVFGSYNLISEATWSRIAGQFVGRELGRLRVVGREQPVTVYELLGVGGESVPARVTDFSEGLGLCRANRWAEALRVFERHPDDPPSRAYAALCRKYLAGETATPWDGVWNLTEK